MLKAGSGAIAQLVMVVALHEADQGLSPGTLDGPLKAPEVTPECRDRSQP